MDSSPPPPPGNINWDLDLFPLDLEDDILSQLFDLPNLHTLLELPENSSQSEVSPRKRSLEDNSNPEVENCSPTKIRKVDQPAFNNLTDLYANPVAHCSKNPPPEVNILPITDDDLELLNNSEHNLTPSVLPSQKRKSEELNPEDMTGNGDENEPPFEIIEETHRDIKKYSAVGSLTTFKFRDLRENENFYVYLEEMFSALVEFLTRRASSPGDRIGLTIYNRDKPDQRPIGISLRRVDQLNAEVILQMVEQIPQSNEHFFVDGVMEVSIVGKITIYLICFVSNLTVSRVNVGYLVI